ncbi:MAG TPA: hypothetical protein VIG33_13815 [Pseudobdellovibrionaceae bacterium]|jgi:hypothetical protein
MAKALGLLAILISIYGLAKAGVGDKDSDLCFEVKDSQKFLKVNTRVVPQGTPPEIEKIQELEKSVLKFYGSKCADVGKSFPLEKFFSAAYGNCFDKCKTITYTDKDLNEGKAASGYFGDFCRSQCTAYNWQASAWIEGKKEGEKSCSAGVKTNIQSPASGKR